MALITGEGMMAEERGRRQRQILYYRRSFRVRRMQSEKDGGQEERRN